MATAALGIGNRAARDLSRIERELQFLVQQMGWSVYFSDDGSLLYFPGVRLPEIYYQRATPMLIHVPLGYGYGASLSDIYVDRNLGLRSGAAISRKYDQPLGGGWEAARNPVELARTVHYEGRIPPLSYICVHSAQDVTFDEYLEQVVTYLSNPIG